MKNFFILVLLAFSPYLMYAGDVDEIRFKIKNYIASSLESEKQDTDKAFDALIDYHKPSSYASKGYTDCDAELEKSSDVLEIESEIQVYQHYEKDERFELDNIKKHIKRIRGAFSTGVLYSDYTDSSYMINRFSLGLQINKYLSVYVHVSDIEEL